MRSLRNRQALKAGVKDGFAEIEAFIASNADDPLASGKFFGTRELPERKRQGQLRAGQA
jgi:hypothetical protein